ncbi:MAG: spore coat associated protein CotJA [Firmicutes bacterium]|nr:spore coat associated protein CotJA [Bacillota bacterium]
MHNDNYPYDQAGQSGWTRTQPRRPARGETAQCNLPLAMAWFGDQKFGTMYNPAEAMKRGTLFPELDKPWLAAKGGH